MCAEKKKITLTCEVDSYRSGWTIVRFLSHRFKYHPPERWTTRVADGFVQVNGRDVSTDEIVNKGDIVTYTIFHAEPEVDFRYEVIYEDEWLLAISKSGNIPVHACGVYIRNTLIATLKNVYGENLNLAHRLDRETSGLTLLTKDAETSRAMGCMFARGEVGKVYSAVVHGVVREASFEVDAPIGKVMEPFSARFAGGEVPGESDGDLAEDRPRYVPRRCVDFERGKPAVTRFEVEKILGDFTLLRAIPLSGRTNQIRVHLDYIGHPIVGDKVYKPRLAAGTGDEARESDKPLIDRQALHCRELRFVHPVTRDEVHLRAAYPEDMARLIDLLEL